MSLQPTAHTADQCLPISSLKTHWRTVIAHGVIGHPRSSWTAYKAPRMYPTAEAAHKDQTSAAEEVVKAYGLDRSSGQHGLNFLTVECAMGECPLRRARKAGLIR